MSWGTYIATQEHPSSDGCFVTYWGCEISTPKLSIEDMEEIFGYDDSDVTFMGTSAGFESCPVVGCPAWITTFISAFF